MAISLSTHVLDTMIGKPAASVEVSLHRGASDRTWLSVVNGKTNEDGRSVLASEDDTEILESGKYRLEFAIGDYFRRLGVLAEKPFLDVVAIEVELDDSEGHYHIPLLVSPYSYSTYRGS